MMSRPAPHSASLDASTEAPQSAQPACGKQTPTADAQPACDKHTAPDAPTACDKQTASAPQKDDAQPADPTDAPTAEASASSDWYTDTLRAIVSRALDADKPDIKGALAALQLLAETEDTSAKEEDDVARILRDARRRVINGRQN